MTAGTVYLTGSRILGYKPLTMPVRDYLDSGNRDGKTHPNCGWHQDGDPELYRKEKGIAENQCLSLLPDCGCQVTSALSSCHHAFYNIMNCSP